MTNVTNEPTVLLGHKNYVSSARFSPDGNLLASASTDNTVRLWQLDQPDAEPVVLRLPGLDPWFATFSPDGRTLAASSLEGVHLWEVADIAAEPTVLNLGTNWMTEVAYSPDGGRLAAANSDSFIYVQDLAKPDTPPVKLSGHEGRVWTVAFSPDGKSLASGSADTTVRLWDLNEPDAPSTILGRHNDVVWGLQFSPDGKRLATGSKDGDVRLWNVEDLSETPAVLHGHAGGVWSLSFNPDGTTLASSGEDSEIRIWDLTHPRNASTSQELADLVCEKVWRNPTLDEWHKFVGEDLPYERTCPNLPIHPSLFETAEKRAKAGDVEAAVVLYQRAVELDPTLQLDPKTEAERLANSGGQ
jgi:WD40 repeat protein